MKEKQTIAVLEPVWHGLGYIDVANARGFEVIVIVSTKKSPSYWGYSGKYNDMIIADVRDPDEVIKAVKASKYNGKIQAFIPGNEFMIDIASKVSEHFNLIGASFEATRRARRKDLAREAYAAAGLINLKYAVVSDLEEAKKAAFKIGYPLVLKPSDSSGSQKVSLVTNDNELEQDMNKLLALKETYLKFKPTQKYLIEEYIEGQEFSIELFLYKNELAFGAVTEKQTSPLPNFTEICHTLPTSIYKDKVDELIECSKKAVLALGFSDGPFHVEIKLSTRGPIVIETNGRASGDFIMTDLIINAFGINLFDAALDYYLGLPFSIKPTKNMASTVAFLVSDRKGTVKSVEGIEELDKQKNIVKHSITVKPGDIVRIAQVAQDRLGYVITVAQTPEEAKESANQAISSVRLGFE